MLEGIGYIKKLSKNKLKWIGQNEEYNYKEEMDEISLQINKLENEERRVDEGILKVQETINDLMEDESTTKHAYINEEDLKSLNINSFDGPFFVIEAPKNTNMDYFSPKLDLVDLGRSELTENPYKI